MQPDPLVVSRSSERVTNSPHDQPSLNNTFPSLARAFPLKN
jgi:hypothetical protein